MLKTIEKSGDVKRTMADLTTLTANLFEPDKATCRAIIETPKGFRWRLITTRSPIFSYLPAC